MFGELRKGDVMEFAKWDIYFVGEHHFALSFSYQEQPFVIFVSGYNQNFQVSNIVHDGSYECRTCLTRTHGTWESSCLGFLLNRKLIESLEQEMLLYLNEVWGAERIAPWTYTKKSSFTKHYMDKLSRLIWLSMVREETILSYGGHFDYYVTDKENRVFGVDLDGKTIKHNLHDSPSNRVNVSDLKVFLEHFRDDLLDNKLEDLELNIVEQYNIKTKKWGKIGIIVEVFKAAILYNKLLGNEKADEMSNLIMVYLHEILHRELGVVETHGEELMLKHELISNEIKGYLSGHKSFDQLFESLVKNPYDESKDRQERVIFAIKSLQLADVVMGSLKHGTTAAKSMWFEGVYCKLLQYLHVELGISYRLNVEKKNEDEQFLLVVLRKYFQGEYGELEVYKKIESKLPYSIIEPLEAVNNVLQEASDQAGNALYYMMEIPFKKDVAASLQNHIAYYGLEKVEGLECQWGTEEEDQKLMDWLKSRQYLERLKLELDRLITKQGLHVWKVKTEPLREQEPDLAEYVIYNGEQLYRMHFRKKEE